MSINRPHHRSGTVLFILVFFMAGCNPADRTIQQSSDAGDEYPGELVDFVPYEKNPVFTGTGADTWDQKIRERGFILKEDDGYHMWYTGFRDNPDQEMMALGYATSADGISWKRYSGNPVFTESWVEDMMVIKHDSLYYMFAEGRHDIAHLLTSRDKIHWKDVGTLKITHANGEPLSPGPYGTPTVYVEGTVWHLFYERNDLGIWHATSTDLVSWRNVSDEPVIAKGPEAYDRYGVALNQIVRHGNQYFAYYHGTPYEDWSDWNTNVAVSDDLEVWKKYPGNPILRENKSSGILVHDGQHYRLYTMHDQVHLHFPSGEKR